TDPTIPVFLISLKAGGSGLNPTAAAPVIHFDPWWNPAVEDQATDRAHRLGQKKVVSAYRLVAAGTIEDKISEPKARKKDLATARAPRTGQTTRRPVARLVAAGTSGEKISELKARKTDLVSAVLEADQGGAKKLSPADTEELFRID